MTSAVSVEKLRAWWAHRQGLDGGLAGATAAEVLAGSGWARSIGSSTPYLALFARAGLDREQVDADVAGLAIHELPSARGCAYLLPQRDFALGLTLGLAAAVADVSTATRKLPVTQQEIDELGGTVLAILEAAGTPLDPAAIRERAGSAVRSLGEEGKKKGHGTTLPMTLGLLQSRGQIRRVPAGGRLDQQRFSYVRWSAPAYPADLDAAHAELARLYFGWAAPASLKHFQWFAGLSATAARKAVAQVPLVPVAGAEHLLLPADLVEQFAAFVVPPEPSYALVTAFDGIHLLHRDLGRLLDGPDAARPVPGGKPGRTLGDEPDPPTMIIVDRGRVAGLWEYDVEAGDIAYQSFGASDGALKEAVARTADYIRDQLGDARTVSLDSPRSRAPRIAALRAG